MKIPQIPGYRLTSELGRTPGSVVLRGQSNAGQPVAVKFLLDLEPDGLARFEREQRLLASLGLEKGFVPLLEKGTSSLGPYLVMPFLPGGTLRTRIRDGPLAIEAAAGLAERLATALGAAHAIGIIHRDVKPDNVLFDERGRAFVADLGIGKHFRRDVPGGAESSPLTSADIVMGTRGYMAPEQVQSAVDASPPADVFAVGAVLFECLTGRRVYDNLVEIEKQVTSSVSSLTLLRPETPPWLASIVRRCLALEPGARFQDGRALAAALVAGAPATEVSLRTKVPASRARVALAAGVMAAVVLAGVRLGMQLNAKEHRIAALEQERAGLEQEKLTLERALAAARDEAKATRTVAEGNLSASLRAHGQALASEASGHPGEAVEVLAALLKQHPTAAPLWAARAHARLATFDLGSARADVARALEFDPDDALALTVHADVCTSSAHDQVELARALEEATRACSLDARSAYSRAVRGEVLGALGRADEAIESLGLALLLDDRFASAVAWRARAHVQKALEPTSPVDAELKLAIEDARHAIALEPRHAFAHAYLGWALGASGRLKEALEECDTAVSLGPGRPRILTIRAWVRLQARDNDGVIADCSSALQIDDKEHTAYRNLGFARRAKLQLPFALEAFAKCNELAPKDPLAPMVAQAMREIEETLARQR